MHEFGETDLECLTRVRSVVPTNIENRQWVWKDQTGPHAVSDPHNSQ